MFLDDLLFREGSCYVNIYTSLKEAKGFRKKEFLVLECERISI